MLTSLTANNLSSGVSLRLEFMNQLVVKIKQQQTYLYISSIKKIVSVSV